MSIASSSEESQPSGFIGHATKFVSGMFGVGGSSTKKNKGQVKSLQLAAAVAKKVPRNSCPEICPAYVYRDSSNKKSKRERILGLRKWRHDDRLLFNEK
jgi:hypothetical protein